jgi:hypothetical protein
MNIKLVTDKISLDEAKEIGKEFYDDMVKGAVDIEKGSMAIGGEYHIDASTVLTDNGSAQKDIWGFNIVFGKPKEERLEYTALINIKPAVGNKDMYVQDPNIRAKMGEIINAKVIWE